MDYGGVDPYAAAVLAVSQQFNWPTEPDDGELH